MKIIDIFFITCAIFLLFWLILIAYIIINEYDENYKINGGVYQVNINWQIKRILIKANTSKTLPYRFIGTYKECINFISQYKSKS